MTAHSWQANGHLNQPRAVVGTRSQVTYTGLSRPPAPFDLMTALAIAILFESICKRVTLASRARLTYNLSI